MFSFKIVKKDKTTKARAGILTTPHGKIHTPAFAATATKGTLRGIDFPQAQKIGTEVLMINTFHFYISGAYKVVKDFGGLHKFLNIKIPLMTDSGGFQVFSLGLGREYGISKITTFKKEKTGLRPIGKNLIKITDKGIVFSSPKDGLEYRLDSEFSIKIQKILGADLIFAFDECTPSKVSYKYMKKSLKRTHQWAEESLKVFGKSKKQELFGIVQGANFKSLREESAKFISSLPFFGYGIGGSYGKEEMNKILEWTMPILKEKKPVHLLGVGEIDDIFEAIEKGVDLFDCVMPTRVARRGTALTKKGKINLKKAKHLKDKNPIDKNCDCFICKNYSKAYLCHLLREKEFFATNLLVYHNLFFVLKLMKDIRKSILKGEFKKLKIKWLKNLKFQTKN